MIYDDLDRHLPVAGAIERAAVPLGMYLAWCVNLQLTGRTLEDEAGSMLLRLRYREKTGSELLLAVCGGVLDAVDVEDDWDHYDRLAPLLTRRYLGEGRGTDRRGRRWWKFWR